MAFFKNPLFPFLITTSFLSGCGLIEKYDNVFDFGGVETKFTEQETVYIYCDEGNIQDYLDKGWQIIDSETEEVPCTWKTEKARPGCKLQEKGCRITVPDKMGEQVKYILEREVEVNTEENNDEPSTE